MADQINILHPLDAHHGDQPAIRLVAPKSYPGGNFIPKLLRRHVGIVPAISGDNTMIRRGGGIDDLDYHRMLVITTSSDAVHDLCQQGLTGPEHFLGEHVANGVEVELVGGDQVGGVGNHRIDITHQFQSLVEIGDMDAHRLADQLHEVQ